MNLTLCLGFWIQLDFRELLLHQKNIIHFSPDRRKKKEMDMDEPVNANIPANN